MNMPYMTQKNCLRKVMPALALTCAVSTLTLFGSPAQAQTPTNFTIKGKVSDTSCTPVVNDGIPVILDEIDVGEIPERGDTAGLTIFGVMPNCSLNNGRAAKGTKVYFYADHVTDGRLNLTSGSGFGWQYQLLPAGDEEEYQQLDVHTSPVPSDNPVDMGYTNWESPLIYYAVRYYRSSRSSFRPGDGITTVNAVLFFP